MQVLPADFSVEHEVFVLKHHDGVGAAEHEVAELGDLADLLNQPCPGGFAPCVGRWPLGDDRRRRIVLCSASPLAPRDVCGEQTARRAR